MRISDWSSDVCSSDLEIPLRATDQDGNPLILGLMNESPFRPLPDFISLTDHGDGTGTIRIAPGANQRGDTTILAYATDNGDGRSEEHTSELQSLMRISYAVFCLKKKTKKTKSNTYYTDT